MKVCEPDAFIVQFVEMRRLDHCIAMGPNIVVSLVVRDDQDNIGFGSRHLIIRRYAAKRDEQQYSKQGKMGGEFHYGRLLDSGVIANNLTNYPENVKPIRSLHEKHLLDLHLALRL